MGDVGNAYAGCRARITQLVADLDDERAALVVATCPRWTVHDVVAHLAGVVSDARAGRIDGVATDPWTAAQVQARRDRTIVEMIEEWNEDAPWFESVLDDFGNAGLMAVADVVAHEHDIRTALGRPGARDSDAVRMTFASVMPGFVASSRLHGVALCVRTTDGMEFGAEGADVVLTGDRFELMRATTGRRSVEQLLAMSWQGDAAAVIPTFTIGPFRPAAQPIDE